MTDQLFYVGVLQLTVVFLSIAAGIISITLFKVSKKHEVLSAWKTLIVVLILFAFGEILGILDAFNIYREIAFLRHVMPSFILGFLIVAIVQQIFIIKGKA